MLPSARTVPCISTRGATSATWPVAEIWPPGMTSVPVGLGIGPAMTTLPVPFSGLTKRADCPLKSCPGTSISPDASSSDPTLNTDPAPAITPAGLTNQTLPACSWPTKLLTRPLNCAGRLASAGRMRLRTVNASGPRKLTVLLTGRKSIGTPVLMELSNGAQLITALCALSVMSSCPPSLWICKRL